MPGSSEAEQRTVNAMVAGSIPAPAAKLTNTKRGIVKKTPGSKHAMRLGLQRYRQERERFRAKLRRQRDEAIDEPKREDAEG